MHFAQGVAIERWAGPALPDVEPDPQLKLNFVEPSPRVLGALQRTEQPLAEAAE